MIWQIIFLITCYLWGAMSFGFFAGKIFKGIDVTEHGWRKMGGSNVARTAGVGPAIISGALDISKGVLPVLIGNYLGWPMIGAIGGVLGVVGHNWSIFLKRGEGRGGGAGLGLAAVLAPKAFLYCFIIFIIFWIITKHTPIPMILFFSCLPVAVVIFRLPYWQGWVFIGLLLVVVVKRFSGIKTEWPQVKDKWHIILNRFIFDASLQERPEEKSGL
ncbi:MAG: glycerol-3-phosphate acyltransferase [Patescibacteria group bacterium]